ncbi:MAG: PEP-CTERM sorting domain-containing protein [Candidatus Nealsonbacteria bacterium]|nr:PEP-CTERM sorting domain-containing protein [Candidatus Nealsonbacteria bacterium]
MLRLTSCLAVVVVLVGTGPGMVRASRIDNALRHTGYHVEPGSNMDLNNNGGLMAMTPYGTALLTDGPGGRGLDFDEDRDFIDTGAIGQNDYFTNLFFGYYNVSAATAGIHEFRDAEDDDRCGIWLDLNQDGVFESSTPGLGSDRGEQLRWEDKNTKSVFLDPGIYMFAVTHGERYGGSRVDVRFRDPTMSGQVTIKPSDPAQAGIWSTHVIPEPSTFILLTMGAIGLLAYGWRRRRL